METYAAALIIEDDQDVLRAARIALSTRFESLVTTRDPNNLEELLTPAIEVVLLDMNFAAGQHSGGAGLEALARIQRVDTSVSVVGRVRQRAAWRGLFARFADIPLTSPACRGHVA